MSLRWFALSPAVAGLRGGRGSWGGWGWMARRNGVVVFIWGGEEEEAVYCDGSFCRKFVSLLGCSKEQKGLLFPSGFLVTF
jgi:hypothetical protein